MLIGKIKYERYIISWLNDKKLYVKESTYANYSFIVYNYIIPEIGYYNLKQLNNSLLQHLVVKLYEKNLSIKTIKDIIMVIKSSLIKAFDDNKVKKFSLKLNYPKEKNIKKVNVLSRIEQHILMEYVLNNNDAKNLGILITMYCGLRTGEICALKWKDIDMDNKIIYVNKTLQRIFLRNEKRSESKVIITTPKSKKSCRDIPINDALYKTLIKNKKKDDYYVLSGNLKYIEPRVYRIYFSNLLKKLKLKHFNYHSLRHTFASTCISLGIDYKTVSELLGHSTIALTLNLYVHPSLQDKIKCTDAIAKNLMYK